MKFLKFNYGRDSLFKIKVCHFNTHIKQIFQSFLFFSNQIKYIFFNFILYVVCFLVKVLMIHERKPPVLVKSAMTSTDKSRTQKAVLLLTFCTVNSKRNIFFSLALSFVFLRQTYITPTHASIHCRRACMQREKVMHFSLVPGVGF